MAGKTSRPLSKNDLHHERALSIKIYMTKYRKTNPIFEFTVASSESNTTNLPRHGAKWRDVQNLPYSVVGKSPKMDCARSNRTVPFLLGSELTTALGCLQSDLCGEPLPCSLWLCGDVFPLLLPENLMLSSMFVPCQ
jgi:hypothetical protein